MLYKIISGAQTGADQGGLDAGKRFGLETGGQIPKGFLTETGPNPKLALDYGVTEHASTQYPPRTLANVQNSDATIRFANNFNSAGEICTLNAINQCDKPYLDIHIYRPLEHEVVVQWLKDHHVKVLNVAGNRESKCIGLHEFTVNYLTQVFECYFGSSE